MCAASPACSQQVRVMVCEDDVLLAFEFSNAAYARQVRMDDIINR